MTSKIETLATIEILENRSNGHAQQDTSGTQLPGHWSRNHESARQSEQEAQQRERLALLGTSAVIFAHEVSNPLHAITATVELIAAEFGKRRIVDPSLMDMIQGAMREGHRLRKLLREFRLLAKPQDPDLQLADLAKIIEEVLAQQKPEWRAAGITVKFECGYPLPQVMLDADKITQVILNLCKNAVEAMPDGGCLSIQVYPASPMIVVKIADSGIGIPAGVDIFQLFKTTKPGGSGLGLSIVQQIIFAHRGTIDYVTELGRGTTFTVKLPAKVGQNVQTMAII